MTSENQFQDGLPEEELPVEQGTNQPVIGDAPPTVRTIFSNRAYDIAKFWATIVLPAFATFYATIGSLWGFPAVDKTVGTIVALDLLLGALLQISNTQFKNAPKQYDGTMFVKQDTNFQGDKVLKAGYVMDTPAELLEKKDEVTLKVQGAPEDLM